MSLGSFRSLSRWAPASVIALSLATLASAAAGAVRHQGVWPEQEPPVSLKVEGVPAAAAVRQLADAAGWSVVTRGLPDTPVTLDVRDQPPGKVLDQLLKEGDFVAERDGALISVGPATATAHAPGPAASLQPPDMPAVALPPEVPEPPAAATAPSDGPEDRTITGGNLRIEANEVVGDVTVMGGNLDLLGTAKGDVTVVGGSARLYKGAHVTGDASAVGGSLVVDDGAKVDGELSVTGGSLERAGEPHLRVSLGDGDDESEQMSLGLHHGSHGGTLARLVDDAGHAVERSLMLFVLGVILIALGSGRMETLEAEVAARPMRSLALGVVGFIASIAVFVGLCITLIGIPIAVLGVIAGLLLVGAGVCAVLTTAGGALVGHRTKNPYVHLAVGSFLFLLLGSIPYFGGMVTATVAFMGIGSLVAARIAGLLPRGKRNGLDQGPYRTAATG